MPANMTDPTESTRRALVAQTNANATARKELEERHGEVFDSDEVREQFTVTGFAAPFMVVVRKADNLKGSLMFQHSPRFYWGFSAH